MINSCISIVKSKLIVLFTIFLGFIAPIKGLFIIVSFAVALDTSVALYYVIKNQGLKAFQSTKFFNIVIKTFFYMGTIMLGFLADVFILEDYALIVPFFISKFLCILWTFIEMKSLDETSVKAGNKSIFVIIPEMISKLKSLKKDLNELKSEGNNMEEMQN